ncbi:hypothetical protein JJV70_22080, partial [Streptomyces sp. JJ66]|uniref:hypothetical protein n=1 Tax=Streptomyces sp. JJ66 TaxID=2803843 RepID=UPI001C5A34DC
MVLFTTLRDLDPAEFDQAADGYHTVSSAASEAKDRLTNETIAKAFPDTSNSKERISSTPWRVKIVSDGLRRSPV